MYVHASPQNPIPPHALSASLQGSDLPGENPLRTPSSARLQLNEALSSTLYEEDMEATQYGQRVESRQEFASQQLDEVPGQYSLTRGSGCLDGCLQAFGMGARRGGTDGETGNPPVEDRAPSPAEDRGAEDVHPIVTAAVSGNPGQQQTEKVAILGGGNVGQMLVADVTAHTSMQPVLLFSGDGTRGDRITPSTGTVQFQETLHKTQFNVDLTEENFGYVDTPRGQDILREAKIIICTLPDASQIRLPMYQDFIAKGLVADPDKTLVLIRAGQAGQPAMSQIIRDEPTWRSSVVLVEDSPYGGRYSAGSADSGPSIVGKRKDSVEIAVLGEGGDQTRGLAAMRSMFPLGEAIGKASWPDFEVRPGSAMPWRAGHYIHPGVAFDERNLEKTRQGIRYQHYNEGIYEELGEKLGQLDQEEVQLGTLYNGDPKHFAEKLERQYNLPLQDESFYATMQRTGEQKIYTSLSYPDIDSLMRSRYPQEDVPGIFTMNWFADRAGADLPGHKQYEAEIKATLLNLGMSEQEWDNNLRGYLPILDRIQGGVAEICHLLDNPHDRSGGPPA